MSIRQKSRPLPALIDPLVRAQPGAALDLSYDGVELDRLEHATGLHVPAERGEFVIGMPARSSRWRALTARRNCFAAVGVLAEGKPVG